MLEEELKKKLRKELKKDLIEISRRLSHDLWNVSCFNEKLSGLSPRLIFPVKRTNEEIRISEQDKVDLEEAAQLNDVTASEFARGAIKNRVKKAIKK